MVVKSATKKKLMDMLVPEEFAHKLADDRKWDDVKILTAQEIAQFCETDSDTAARIHGIIWYVYPAPISSPPEPSKITLQFFCFDKLYNLCVAISLREEKGSNCIFKTFNKSLNKSSGFISKK